MQLMRPAEPPRGGRPPAVQRAGGRAFDATGQAVWRTEPAASAAAPSFQVEWARSDDDVAEAQRLRFRVVAGEMGACLQARADVLGARDIDRFDAQCDHLLVRASGGGQHGKVVATCRVPTSEGAHRAPETLFGCSSISVRDGGSAATQLWYRLKRTHLVPAEWQVRPWKALALAGGDAGQDANGQTPVPALMKGYLRCGGKLLGPPAMDAAFNAADFPMLMQLGDLPARDGKRIFGVCE